MAVYYWFYSILIFVAILIYARKKPIEQQHKKFCVVSFFMLFLLLSCRHPYMGVDLGWGNKSGYLYSFNVLGHYSFREILKLGGYLNYEKGYVIFNKLVSLISNEQQFFLGTCAFVGLLPIAIYIYKRSKIPLLSMLVFMGIPTFLIFFSGLRQAIAIGITVASMFFVENRKKLWFVLTILLATTFHSSAIIFLVAYPLYHMRTNNIGRLVMLAFIPVVFVFKEPLFLILSKLFTENAEMEETGALTLFLVFILIYVFLIVFNDTCEFKNADDEKQNGMINLFYAACICQAFGGIYNTAVRVGYYFMFYMVIAIPNTMENFKHLRVKYNSYYTIVMTVIGAIFVFYGLHTFAHGTWSRTNPYIFFWEF